MSGCTYHHIWNPEDSRPTQPLPDGWREQLSIEGEQHTYTEKLVKTTDDYEQYEVEVLLDGKMVSRMYWYRSRKNDFGTPRPVDFIWPILAGSSDPVVHLYSRQIFTPMGIDTIVIRQTDSVFSLKKLRSVPEVHEFHVEVIRGLMRVVRWAKTKNQLDSKRFGMTGTSYGGILTALSMTFYPEFVSFKIVMGAGDIDEILSESIENRVVRWREALFKKMRKQLRDEIKSKNPDNYQRYRKVYNNWVDAEIQRLFVEQAQQLPWDPRRLAKYGDPSKIAMVITLEDHHVMTKNQKALWQEYGKPDAMFVRTGHYTIVLAYFQLRSYLREMAQKHYQAVSR